MTKKQKDTPQFNLIYRSINPNPNPEEKGVTNFLSLLLCIQSTDLMVSGKSFYREKIIRDT